MTSHDLLTELDRKFEQVDEKLTMLENDIERVAQNISSH